MRLYIEGHHHRLGYAISREYTDDEIRALPPLAAPEKPLRYRHNRRHAFRLVARFNRRFAPSI